MLPKATLKEVSSVKLVYVPIFHSLQSCLIKINK